MENCNQLPSDDEKIKRICKNVLCMQYQLEAFASDLGDDQSRYLLYMGCNVIHFCYLKQVSVFYCDNTNAVHIDTSCVNITKGCQHLVTFMVIVVLDEN